MPSKLTRRQLTVSILAVVDEVGYKEIGARVGMSRAMVAEYLSRRRKTELDEDVYEQLLSAVAKRRASATLAEAFLETLDALDRETDLTEEEVACIVEEVLTGARLMRQLLVAAIRKSRQPFSGDGYPDALEAYTARQQAEEQFAELKRLRRPRARLAVVKLNHDYQTWALMERCCEAAAEEASRDLKESAVWARLALAIAKWVRGPESWRSRCRGYALGHWANLLKVRELPGAEARRGEARRLWLGGADPAGLLARHDPGLRFES